MSEKPIEPAASKLFSVPVLVLLIAAVAAVAYGISHKGRPSAAGVVAPALPAPTFAVHSGPPSPKLPSEPKYIHVQGAWCSYAGELPIYFCGKDEAACEAAGPGSVCIQGGQTLWCLERFDANDSVDRADCYWTPNPCTVAQAKDTLSSTLRVACKEYARN